MRLRATLAVALVVLLLPLLAVPRARAAEYTMDTAASYLVDPATGEVAVSVAVTFTNTLPDPPGQVSAFSHVDLAIQAGASEVLATDERGELHVDVEHGDGEQVASVRTRSRVRYGKSVTFTLEYRLTDGAAPGLYVRPGVVKFPVWGFGTSSQVGVQLPAGYETRADGDPMAVDTAGPGIRLTSGPISDPGTWLAVVTAVLPADYLSRSATVALASATVDLQVRAWRADPRWGERTLALLVNALPLLEVSIGLPYPHVGQLVVSEAAAGEVGGRAASPASAEIQVAFDASDYTLLHQAAHVWIDEQLAEDRWIVEGLASHYAAEVAAELDVELPYDPAERAASLVADARPLVDWRVGTLGDHADAYGYAASWALVDRIATAVGEAHLAVVLKRVVAGVAAYDSVQQAEIDIDGRPFPAVDARRFLDQLSAVSSTDLSDLFAKTVFGSDASHELDQRRVARHAYGALLDQAGDWGAPDPVRRQMAEWRFDEGLAGIDAASTWLTGRDQLIEDCAAAGLVPPQRLRERYQAVGGGAEATAELEAEQALADAFAALQSRAAAPRGPLDAVGLLLSDDPMVLLARAAGSFSEGDLQGAAETLDRLELTINRAPADGAVRLAGITVVLMMLGLGAGVWFRRRSGSHYTAGR